MFRNIRFLGNKGNAILEFAVCLPVLVVAMFTVLTGGFWFDRYMTVLQLGRTGASMFARGMNFSTSANQDLLLMAAHGLRMQKTGGDGVIYLTRLVQAPPGSANDGELVMAERYVIGDSSIRSSKLGTPSGTIWPDPTEPQPNGSVKDYQDEPSAVASVPSSISTLPLGESMFVTEVYHDSQDLNFGRAFITTPLQLAATIYY